MTIYHTVTYTQLSAYHGSRYESTTNLTRPYRLTEAGAQRILRRETGYASAVVTRVEYAVRSR